ncbi:uncharacterized protein LOC110268409 [Arachis ipaensis]|uniref:uncharacterized protein LOC110268409 n=1 Tax=Arachis ipaensis TaxID=130454 RepID=UPI000A2AF18C|nr:uncharacterized protein LOC110268409 [Arachis ipaensis]
MKDCFQYGSREWNGIKAWKHDFRNFVMKLSFWTQSKKKRSEIETEELEEILRESRKKKNNEKSAAQGEKEADLRSTEGHYVSFETIPEVNLGSDDHLSQGHTDQSSVNKPVESIKKAF